MLKFPTLKKKTPPPPPPHKTDWKEWEADLLVQCGLKRQLVSVYHSASGETRQSFVHGFDLASGELLLDGLYPNTGQPLNEGEQCWLQINSAAGIYNLHVVLQEILGGDAHPLLSVRVLESGLVTNRRWRKRVYFERGQMPQVSIKLGGFPALQGQVLNLSQQGAMLEVCGENLRASSQLGRTLRTRIDFSPGFFLELRASLKQCRFTREPYCHNLLRVQFQLMSADNRGLLDNYIDSLV